MKICLRCTDEDRPVCEWCEGSGVVSDQHYINQLIGDIRLLRSEVSAGIRVQAQLSAAWAQVSKLQKKLRRIRELADE
jgi:hypothetical protein